MRFTLTRTSCYSSEKSERIHPNAQWDSKREEWYIDFRSLNDLKKFVDEIDCRRIIITTYTFDKFRPEIEIYDDYRE